MAILFSPDGALNIAHDPADLPEAAGDTGSRSGAMTRCKNLRLDERGKAKTRDGSAALNGSAMGDGANWLEVQAGTRYAFAGTVIYEDETSLETGLTDAVWSAMQYSAYNDATPNVFALNGTDRKRIEDGAVYEWGLEAPTIAPTLAIGIGTGLTGKYNAKYTYVRKVDGVVVAESNPSPAASVPVVLADQSMSVTVTQPDDTQVTHIRVYRTSTNGEVYNYDSEISAGTRYTYAYVHDWEESEDYVAGNGYHWTTTADVTISDGTGSAPSGGSSSSSGRVNISDAGPYVYASGSAAYKLGSDGKAYYTADSASYVAISGQWLITGSNSDYECRATKVSGSTPTTGTIGSWESLGSDRAWTLAVPTSGTRYSVLTIEIRAASTEVVLVTATVELTAESSTGGGIES